MLADKIKLELAAIDPTNADTCLADQRRVHAALLAVVDFIEREPWLTNIGDRQLDVIASALEVHDG